MTPTMGNCESNNEWRERWRKQAMGKDTMGARRRSPLKKDGKRDGRLISVHKNIQLFNWRTSPFPFSQNRHIVCVWCVKVCVCAFRWLKLVFVCWRVKTMFPSSYQFQRADICKNAMKCFFNEKKNPKIWCWWYTSVQYIQIYFMSVGVSACIHLYYKKCIWMRVYFTVAIDRRKKTELLAVKAEQRH